MTQTSWRIAVDTRDYEADDMTGTGARASGGRWNDVGTPTVYSSENRSLACLETLAHFANGDLPLNRILVRIDIPDDLSNAALVTHPSTLPIGWDVEPPGRASIAFGQQWLMSSSTAILFVPSVIVIEERNVLINPLHPDAYRIKATKVRRWNYDARLV